MMTTSNADTDPRTSETRRSPLLLWLLFAGMLAVFTAVLLEVALRATTKPFQKLGVRQLMGVPLLPFKTDRQVCQEAQGLEVINLFSRFSHSENSANAGGYFLPGGHLNRRGNLAVAEELQAFIASRRDPARDPPEKSPGVNRIAPASGQN